MNLQIHQAPNKKKELKAEEKVLDLDKDDEIKKAREKVIKDIVAKAHERPRDKNYLIVDKQGRAKFDQPKNFKKDLDIAHARITSAFKKSPVKTTKSGKKIISLLNVKDVPTLESELENYFEDVDVSNDHVEQLQADDTQWDTQEENQAGEASLSDDEPLI